MVTASDSAEVLPAKWETGCTDEMPADCPMIGRTSMLHFDSVT